MYTAISIKGDSKVVKAMKRLAMRKQLETGKSHTVGEMVLNAVVHTYGDDFAKELSFFANDDDFNHHLLIAKDSA